MYHKAVLAGLGVIVACACSCSRRQPKRVDADHARIKARYVQYLVGTPETFSGTLGEDAAAGFLEHLRWPVESALKFDYAKNAGKTFHSFQDDTNYWAESQVYSTLLQEHVLSLAYGYCVDAPGSPYYRNPEVLACYIRCLDYLHGRGIRAGMTFHNTANRRDMEGAPKPENGGGNIARMELRMGALCQSVLLMEPFIRDTETFRRARALVRDLEVLGQSSGHVEYYNPYSPPEPFRFLVQSDAMQIYSDVPLVSAMLEEDPARRQEMLRDAQRVFTDSLKTIPGWADTIKPDFVGYHHRGIYGNAYTGGFIPQAAFGVYLLAGTDYAVEAESRENLKQLMLTYRLYCQKYAMPFGIRGRMPVTTDNINRQAFAAYLIYASSLGLNDTEMKAVYKRLWDPDEVTLGFLFFGGRGKLFRGMYALDMLEQLEAEAIEPEPDPNGFWYKPYGGLAIHRRDNWMAAVKGYSKYIWDYENGKPDENVYGQYFSHGSLTIFAQGDPINDIDSGYNLDGGWDWFRMPGTTAVHFPIKPRGPLTHRRFSPETFLGGASVDGQNGLFGMHLNQETFGDGTRVDLKARKSVFFVDDFILMLGSGISGGDGTNAVETTLFQSFLPEGADFAFSESELADPVGNRYYVPDASELKLFKGTQKSYRHNGVDETAGDYAVAWFDHGLAPKDAGYEAGIGVRGAPKAVYDVVRRDNNLHQVRFPEKGLTGYAFFRPIETDDALIKRVSDHCLVMTRQTEGELSLSLANPDLGFLPREAETPTFRFLTEEMNQYLPSQPRPVDIVLKGKWRLKAPSEKVAVTSTPGMDTVLRFSCIHGMDVMAELIRE
jgi:chondroitin-sulfate-ABC endolyase/exolyase